MCDVFTKEISRALVAYVVFFGLAFIVGMWFKNERYPMTLWSKSEVHGRKLKAFMERDESGVVHVTGKDWKDGVFGLGWAHAEDRWQQMCILRLLGQGRLSEVLKPNDVTLYLDRLSRKIGFARYAPEVRKNLENSDLELLEAYVEGVNERVRGANRPLFFVLLGFYPTEWTVEDIILIGMVMPFFGLADNQIKVERFVLEALQVKHGEELVRTMFNPYLNDLNEELVDVLKQVNFQNYFSGHYSLLQDFIGGSMGGGSNNWAVSPKKSKSGKTLFATDPHLQIDRLPAIWTEVVIRTDDNYFMGITCPGAPLPAMGRTMYLSYGFTYAMYDLIDFKVENCTTVEGIISCQNTEGEFKQAKEFTTTIKRKNLPPVNFTWWETEFGMLELNPETTDVNGYYLSMAYSNRKQGTLGTIHGFFQLVNAKSVLKAQKAVKNVDFSLNLLFTDGENIGQSLTGNIPHRLYSGLYPVPAWDKNTTHGGFVDPSMHWTDYNPERGFIATANNDWNNRNTSFISINADLGPYRATRIVNLLREKEMLDLDDMKRIQCDVYSLQAEYFMKHLKPLLAKRNDSVSQIFQEWNNEYDIDSQAATIFEKFLTNIYAEVYGRLFQNQNMFEFIQTFPFRYHLDKVILDYPENLKSLWGNESQQDLFTKVLDKTLNDLPKDPKEIKGIGYESPVVFTNGFFRFLPSWLTEFLGISPKIPIPGSFATVAQKNFIDTRTGPRNGGVSWRMYTDHQWSEIYTSLPGGPSENVFSKWYKNDLQRWKKCQYKKL